MSANLDDARPLRILEPAGHENDPPAAAYMTIRTSDGRLMEIGVSMELVLRMANAGLRGNEIVGDLNGSPFSGQFVKLDEATEFPRTRVAAAVQRAKTEVAT